MKKVLAFVGMPGAGKSEATTYLKDKNVPFLRFGQFTDDEIAKRGLQLIQKDERVVREDFRKKLGMVAYAVMAKPKIAEMLVHSDVIVLDGLYSWEEYILLKEEFSHLTLIQIYAEPTVRYARLAQRPVRPMPLNKSRERDVAELEKLNKGGPIAIADFCIINNEEIEVMYREIDNILKKLSIQL